MIPIFVTFEAFNNAVLEMWKPENTARMSALGVNTQGFKDNEALVDALCVHILNMRHEEYLILRRGIQEFNAGSQERDVMNTLLDPHHGRPCNGLIMYHLTNLVIAKFNEQQSKGAR